MKSIFIIVLLAGVLFFIAGCSSPQKPDPEIEACKSACIKKMELCIKKAAKNEAKKAACEAVGDKCARDCSVKK
ncbi:MAG TPA: hypothetical protein P5120_08985 [Spirochaetota bacterium]|nr:hypothetical protein [Spirochaetota bacterium]HPF06456.1 hypothetical protein [Spirochaetota bacterium]HPJ42889.1 hypothetical protein [Spirochaetota bacterium]HPR37559.1 hypothetical protein [Spirochaetota bacterium]HRX47642.1 hypothetical protein [Spirochaetota bacterium]